ncbi:MAG: BREX system P-loop protein BrxC [Polyangia bacterium]
MTAMRIGELFATRIEDKIEPVIKVGETADEQKLASEIGSYVVTPMIEKYLDDFLEHYTDTFLRESTEIGTWISGYFGSGKSHLAKIMALLANNRPLSGATACDRFAARLPTDAPRRESIKRSLSRMGQCATSVLAFNLNTLADSKHRALPSLLLAQYYQSLGYGGNLLYARVIEAGLDRQGKLDELHAAVERRAKKKWAEIQRNLSFFRSHLYAAACEVAPDIFPSEESVTRALQEAERGELFNVAFLVNTLLDDLHRKEQATKKRQRLLLVLDEAGQWIGSDGDRLAQLQALVEEAAIKGQGRIFIIVTTHGDMGSIYKEARAVEEDMKKIEGRFRFKCALTTENIELVLEDRLFRKKLGSEQALLDLYDKRSGELRGLGELANTNQALPPCTDKKFAVYYPFLPYQIHLIPEIVKSLRSKGGRGEQLSGSTRTLLAITQDILRAGRRHYLDEGVGALVSFDEVYENLQGEGEVSPDVRTELARIKDVVPGATPLTAHVAEVLFLIRELPYVPSTRDNIARLLIESTDDSLPGLLGRVQPELERLISAKLVARIGDEYEFLTGERRSFEEEVATVANKDYGRVAELERGFARHFIYEASQPHYGEWLGFDRISYQDTEFPFKLGVDQTLVPGRAGHVTVKVLSPLGYSAHRIGEMENQSLRPDEQACLFLCCGPVPGLEEDLKRFLAMQEVSANWSRDIRRSEEARMLAQERQNTDVPKLKRRVVDGLRESLRSGKIVFRGATRSIIVKGNQKIGDAVRDALAAFWPSLYPKFDKLPVHITNDQKAILAVLDGSGPANKDVQATRIYDKAGKPDPNSPLLDAVRMYLSTEQTAGRRILGKDLLAVFSAPPYGWDENAVRIGVAALLRAGAVKLSLNKKTYTNPQDSDVVDTLRNSREFAKAELILEDTEVAQDVLTESRSFLIKLLRRRSIDETPAALSEAAGQLASEIIARAESVAVWASPAGLPLPASFNDGLDAWQKIASLTNPVHRVRELHALRTALESGLQTIDAHAEWKKTSSTLFTEMSHLVEQLSHIEHQLGEAPAVRQFLSEHSSVLGAARFADKETWKRLQSYQASARLELDGLLAEWREEARKRLQDAIDRLPADLTSRGLSDSLAISLLKPLVGLQASLDGITAPAQAAALPQRAEQAIRELGRHVLAAVHEAETASRAAPQNPEETKPEPSASPSPSATAPRKRTSKPAAPVTRLRLSDVALVTRFRSVDKWDEFVRELDRQVKDLLASGQEVELS